MIHKILFVAVLTVVPSALVLADVEVPVEDATCQAEVQKTSDGTFEILSVSHVEGITYPTTTEACVAFLENEGTGISQTVDLAVEFEDDSLPEAFSVKFTETCSQNPFGEEAFCGVSWYEESIAAASEEANESEAEATSTTKRSLQMRIIDLLNQLISLLSLRA